MMERLELVILRTALRLADLLVLLGCPRLLVAYVRLWWLEIRRSPYDWPRSFASTLARTQSGQSLRELVYGETPVVTGRKLFARAGVGPGSVVLDLGAGRGRALVAARSLGARALGVELLEKHVRLAAPILNPVGIEVSVGDAAEAELDAATHIYLTWTGYNQISRDRLVEHLRTVRPGTRILAIDCPVEGSDFPVAEKLELLYPWGSIPIWIQVYEKNRN